VDLATPWCCQIHTDVKADGILSVLRGTVCAVTDDRWVQALLVMQHGLLTRAQALEFVTTSRGLQHRARPGGPWRRVLPGVYLTSNGRLNFVQFLMAAQLYAGEPSVVTGHAALKLQQVRGAKTGPVEVLVPAERFVASRDFVAVHRTRRMPVEMLVDGKLRYATATRAIADAVRDLDQLGDARTIVGSAVQRHLSSVAKLTAELAERHDRRDALLRHVLTEVSAGIRSAPEGDLRVLITGSGLPRPLYNPTLFLDGEFLACPDAWWPEAGVAAEVDSMEFHLLPEDWRRTLARGRRMTAAGIAVLHITPAQLRDEPQQVLRDIAAALAHGRALPAIRTVPAR